MTYTALLLLAMLRDDFSCLDRSGLTIPEGMLKQGWQVRYQS